MRFGRGKPGGYTSVRLSANSISSLGCSRLQSDATPASCLSCAAARKLQHCPGLHLDKRALSAEDRVFLGRFECDWFSEHPPAAMDSLERSDREEEIGTWLEDRHIQDARQLAQSLVDPGCDLDTLRMLAEGFDSDTSADVIMPLSVSFSV